MKIALPSAGVLGTATVEMRPPTFADLREMNNSNQIQGLLKADFVKRLVNSKTDFNKITKMDLEYLFLIAAFSVQFNEMSYSLRCEECGKLNKKTFNLSDKEVINLDKKGYPFKKKINGVEYTFHLLSAQDEIDAHDYALQQEDYDAAYEDACAWLTLGNSLNDIEKIKELDATIYLATFLYQRCLFHGVKLEDTVVCSCGKESPVNIVGTSNMVKADVGMLMNQFASVSDHLSFEGFLSFTIPEFKTYIDTLNAKVNG